MSERPSVLPAVEVDGYVVMYTNYYGWVICDRATRRIVAEVVDRAAGIELARTAFGAHPSDPGDGYDE